MRDNVEYLSRVLSIIKSSKGGEINMYMFKYILKRLGLMIMTFLIIFLISFVLIKLLPIVVNVTIGQDKESCVVYGMPMVAFNIGAVAKQLPLEKIGAEIINAINKS